MEERADALLCEALDLPAEERRAFLERACDSDGELLVEVEDLLAGAEATDTTFLRPGGAVRGEMLDELEERLLLGSGTEVGRYRVLREIGRGGMGVVYLAERADGHFDQRVALKVLPAGSDSEALHRFARERQILADLEHPNIARLIDGGVTAAGSPYLIMDYVDGEPIDAYCRRRELKVRQRVDLLIEVCTAVQAAHRQLVVHRDLKPSNILVTADGTVKLLDFGIAKLLDPEASSQTSRATVTAGRFLTPQYASPEQIQGETITVASDIYQLGLLAYELLTERRPYELAGASPAEAVSKICREEPSRPSNALSSPSGAPAGEAAEDTPPLRLRELSGDLDTIILEALRKEPERRYESVERLRDDLQRYLDGRPVSARPDTWGYRLGKYLRRNALAVSAAAATFALVVTLVAAFTWGLARERDQTRRAAQEAREQREETEQVLRFLTGLFEASSPYQDGPRADELTARQILERGAEKIDSAFPERPLIRARLLRTVAELFRQLGIYPEAERQLDEALRLWRQAPDDRRGQAAVTLKILGDVYIQTGRFPQAEQAYREALDLHSVVSGEDSLEVAVVAGALAQILFQSGRYAESEAQLQKSFDIWAAQEDPPPERMAWLYARFGKARSMEGKVEEARSFYEQALDLYRQRFGEQNPWVASALANVAGTYRDQEDCASALPLFQRALEIRERAFGPQSYLITSALENLASCESVMGNEAEATRLYERALGIFLTHQGETSQGALRLRFNLAVQRFEAGDNEAAERDFRRLRELQEEALPPTHRLHAHALVALGKAVLLQGRHSEAEPFLREGMRRFEAGTGSETLNVANARLALAQVLEERGAVEEAEALFRSALEIRWAKLVPESPRVQEVVARYTDFLRAEGRDAEAQALEADLAARQAAAKTAAKTAS